MPETKEHFADLPEEERLKVQLWIRAMLKPTKNAYGHNTYSLKHLMEHDNHVYTTVDQFDEALAEAGFNAGEDAMENNICVNVDRRSLPILKSCDQNIAKNLKHVDRGALVSSLMLLFQSRSQLDKRKAENYKNGSDLLCSFIFEKSHSFYGELLRDAVAWLMEEKQPIGQDAAVDAVLEACGLASV